MDYRHRITKAVRSVADGSPEDSALVADPEWDALTSPVTPAEAPVQPVEASADYEALPAPPVADDDAHELGSDVDGTD